LTNRIKLDIIGLYMSNMEYKYKKGYSLAQASKELELNRMTLARWVRRGFITATRSPVSSRFFISQEEINRLKELLSGRQNNP